VTVPGASACGLTSFGASDARRGGSYTGDHTRRKREGEGEELGVGASRP
jgi:hypothetical protein